MDRRRSNVARTQIFIRVGEKNFTGNSRAQWYVGTIAWLPAGDFSAPPLWPNRGLHLYGVVPMRLYFSFIYFAVLNVVTGRGLRWRILKIHSRCWLNFIPIGFGGCFESSATWWCGWFWIGRCFLQHCDRKRQPGWLAVLCLIFARASFFWTNQILQVLKFGFHMFDCMFLVIWFRFLVGWKNMSCLVSQIFFPWPCKYPWQQRMGSVMVGSAEHLNLLDVPMVSVGPCFCLQDAEAQIDEHVRKSKDQMSFSCFFSFSRAVSRQLFRVFGHVHMYISTFQCSFSNPNPCFSIHVRLVNGFIMKKLLEHWNLDNLTLLFLMFFGQIAGLRRPTLESVPWHNEHVFFPQVTGSLAGFYQPGPVGEIILVAWCSEFPFFCCRFQRACLIFMASSLSPSRFKFIYYSIFWKFIYMVWV